MRFGVRWPTRGGGDLPDPTSAAIVGALERELGVPVDPEVMRAHLEAMELEYAFHVSPAEPRRPTFGRRRIMFLRTCVAAAALSLTTSLAAADALPTPMQQFVSAASNVVGIHLPDPPRRPSTHSLVVAKGQIPSFASSNGSAGEPTTAGNGAVAPIAATMSPTTSASTASSDVTGAAAAARKPRATGSGSASAATHVVPTELAIPGATTTPAVLSPTDTVPAVASDTATTTPPVVTTDTTVPPTRQPRVRKPPTPRVRKPPAPRTPRPPRKPRKPRKPRPPKPTPAPSAGSDTTTTVPSDPAGGAATAS